MDEYKEDLVAEIKSRSESDNITDREAFFQIYCEKLEESELIEDYHYLFFNGKGSRNRTVQIDGFAYSELDEKLVLFIIPKLAYYNEETLTKTIAENHFNKAIAFYFDVDKVVEGIEESTEGYDLARDIMNKKMKVSIIEIILLTDYRKSKTIDIIESTSLNGIRVDYTIFDLDRIESMDEAINGKEALVIDLPNDFNCDGMPVLPASKTDSYEAFLCNIPGELLAKMYDKYQSRLLEGNVRSFLQTKGKVNKGIRNTILKNPEMFFAFNNGIAATAEEIEITKSNQGLLIKKFVSLQIVNGGQTTASLANAWVNDISRNSREQIKEIYVPMKISVVSSELAQDLIPNISRFANSQNKVSDADLASNHPFHIRVEEFSRRILTPAIGGAQYGTYWYYERANGQYRQETYKATKAVKKKFELQYPKRQMFKKVELAKYWNIYLKKPHIASAGAQKSFQVFSKWMLTQWDKNSNFVNENFFKKTIALAILFKEADYIVRQQVWYDSYKANIVAYTLSSIFNGVSKRYPNSTIDFNLIWKLQKLSLGWEKQIQKVSKIMYDHLTDENRTVENVTEWAKRETSWDLAKEVDIPYDKDFILDLIDKNYIESEESTAIKNQKEINEMNALMTFFDYGEAFWHEVYVFGEKEKIWNIQDKDFLKLAREAFEGKKYPSDKQALKILKVLEKAREESFPK